MHFTAKFYDFLRAAEFAKRYPFYAAILAGLHVVEDAGTERMAVAWLGGQVYLHIHPSMLVEEAQFAIGVLLHEIHHIALGHLGNPEYAGWEDQELAELALEMSANEYIQEPLPDPITWQAYARFGVRAGQSTAERYARLLRAKRGQPVAGAGGARAQGPAPASALDSHRTLLTVQHGDPLAAKRAASALLAQAAAAGTELPGASLQDGAQPLLAGTTPGHLLEQLGEAPADPAADWAQPLRMFLATQRTSQVTWSRPNRRFPDSIGRVPGRRYQARLQTRPRLLVALDTSASMQPAELRQVAAELQTIAQYTEIVLAECDTEITRVGAFAGALPAVLGRGGTDLRPIFAAEFLAAQRVAGIVYFTDGAGPTPDLAPGVPVLWVLTKVNQFACTWGARTYLRADDRAAANALLTMPAARKKPRVPRI